MLFHVHDFVPNQCEHLVFHIRFSDGAQLELQTYDRRTRIRSQWNGTLSPSDESEGEKDKIIYPGHHHWRNGSVFRICWYAHVADGRVSEAPYIWRSQPNIGTAIEMSPHKIDQRLHKSS